MSLSTITILYDREHVGDHYNNTLYAKLIVIFTEKVHHLLYSDYRLLCGSHSGGYCSRSCSILCPQSAKFLNFTLIKLYYHSFEVNLNYIFKINESMFFTL